jgi:hypothetical protein
MAKTLSKANIALGNTIQPADVSQSIDALTGLFSYDITISGSLNLTGSVVTGSTANFTSVTASLFGTGSWAVSSSFSISSSRAVSSSFAISSSRAVSSSYAIGSTTATSATTADGVSNQNFDIGGGIQAGTFKFVAGKVVLTGGVGSSSAFPGLNSKVIGVNAFVTATYADGFAFGNPTEPANLMVSVTPDGRVAAIQQANAVDNGSVIFTGIYV